MSLFCNTLANWPEPASIMSPPAWSTEQNSWYLINISAQSLWPEPNDETTPNNPRLRDILQNTNLSSSKMLMRGNIESEELFEVNGDQKDMTSVFRTWSKSFLCYRENIGIIDQISIKLSSKPPKVYTRVSLKPPVYSSIVTKWMIFIKFKWPSQAN